MTVLLFTGTKQIALIERAAARLSWLLDGRDYILAMWSEVQISNRSLQREGMSQIMRAAADPARRDRMGREELDRRHELFQRKRIRALMDWRTGQHDVELVTRLDIIKARASEVSPLRMSGQSVRPGLRCPDRA